MKEVEERVLLKFPAIKCKEESEEDQNTKSTTVENYSKVNAFSIIKDDKTLLDELDAKLNVSKYK